MAEEDIVILVDEELKEEKQMKELKYLVRNKSKMMLAFNLYCLDELGRWKDKILGPRGSKSDRCVLTPEEYESQEVQKLLKNKKLEARKFFE